MLPRRLTLARLATPVVAQLKTSRFLPLGFPAVPDGTAGKLTSEGDTSFSDMGFVWIARIGHWG